MQFRLIAIALWCLSGTAFADGNQPPAITSQPVSVAVKNTNYKYAVIASDPENDPITFSLLEGPPGMTIDATSGVISWAVPGNEAGTYLVHVRATDVAGNYGAQKYNVTVASDNTVNQPPTITSTPVTTVASGSTYAYDVDATDPDNDPLLYALVINPSGMQVDATTGVITWSPTLADVGDHTVRVRVSDPATNAAEQEFTVSVTDSSNGNRPPLFTSTPSTRIVAPATYTYDSDATDPDGNSLTYSLVVAPDGMTIDAATGLVTWPVSETALGAHPVRLRGSDGHGGTAEQVWTIAVVESSCTPSSCGNGTIEPECGEVCDGDLACSSPAGAFASCVDNCTRLDRSDCPAPAAEICGNCIDDDGNGLVDFEDPACCTSGSSTMVITKARLTPHGPVTRVRVKSRLVRATAGLFDPLRQDVYVQLREPGKTPLVCGFVPAAKFMRMSKRVVSYWGGRRPVASAHGISDIAFVNTLGGNVNLRLSGRRVEFVTPPAGTLRLTVGFVTAMNAERPNVCVTVAQPFRAKKIGLRAP